LKGIGDGPVTLAVLCGGTGSALDPIDAARVADDLTVALRAAGATVVDRPAGGDQAARLRDAARLAGETGSPLLLCADNLVAHPSLLWTLATEPAGRSTALVVPDPLGDLREERGRLLPGAGTVRFAGAICIAPADLPQLTAALEKASTVDGLLPVLLDAGLVPIATRTRLLHAERVMVDAELAGARAAIAAVDEDAARLRLAVKEKDDFFTTYAVSSWSPLVTKWCARLGLTPAGVTALSVLFAVAAALAFWQASRPAMIAGAVLLYLGFVLDCVDGQLARYTRRFGAFGGWLDTMADRAKEYAVYAGLAAGAERVGLPYAWPLAIAAIVLQTVRHMTDTWYGALHDEAAARPRPAMTAGVGARLGAASERVQAGTGSVAYWLKRIVVFPIGERWALIGVLAALFDGRVALVALLIWGVLAFAYTLGLRSLRSAAMRVAVLDRPGTSRFRDDGPLVRMVLSRAGLSQPLLFALAAVLAAAVSVAVASKIALVIAGMLALCAGLAARSPHAGPLDWLVPAALRAAEYLLVVAVALVGSVPPPVCYLLLFTLALRHYDVTARMEKGAPGSPAAGALLGWDGRVVLLVVAALAGVATLGEAVLAGAVGGALLIEAGLDRRTRSS
jgi:phosphatidylglycerophosphate synthase